MNKKQYWEEYIKAYDRVIDITSLIYDMLYPGVYNFNRIDNRMTLKEKIEHIKNDMESQAFSKYIDYSFLEQLDYFYPDSITDTPCDYSKINDDMNKYFKNKIDKLYINLKEMYLPLVKIMAIQNYPYNEARRKKLKTEEDIWEAILKDDTMVNLLNDKIENIIWTVMDSQDEKLIDKVLKESYKLDDVEYNRYTTGKNKRPSITMKNEYIVDDKIRCNFSLFDNYFEDMYGQDVAIEQIEKVLKRSILFYNAEDVERNNTKNKGPLATFMFYGPTGTGKTEASKLIADFIYNDKKKLLILDMNSYKDGKIAASAIKGHPEGYVNSENGTDFTRFLKNNDRGVIVLDEFEKAVPEVREIFMTMLDEGEFKDALGNVYDLSSYIFIATTNASEKIDKNKPTIGFNADSKEIIIKKKEKDIKEGLREIFSSPIVNRFNNLVHFRKIEYKDAMNICENVINKLIEKFKSKKFNGHTPTISIYNKEKICEAILKECEYEKDGVRSLKNVINDTIGSAIIEQILNENYNIVINFKDNNVVVSQSISTRV